MTLKPRIFPWEEVGIAFRVFAVGRMGAGGEGGGRPFSGPNSTRSWCLGFQTCVKTQPLGRYSLRVNNSAC